MVSPETNFDVASESQTRAPALAALRRRTGRAHAELERTLLVGAPGAGRAEYARHVAAMWGWMKPTEAALWDGAWPARLDVEVRARKTAWLETDIEAARADGLLGAGLAVADPVACASRAARFGTAYVVEGSMLGGAVLLQRFGERLAPWPARYLRGYGADGARRWRDFLAALDETLVTAGDVGEAADAAEEAFRSIGRWLRAHGAAA